jgi:hypothetical protein
MKAQAVGSKPDIDEDNDLTMDVDTRVREAVSAIYGRGKGISVSQFDSRRTIANFVAEV